MPFLYRLVEGKLQADETTSADLEDGDEPPPNEEEESQDNTAMSGSAEDLPATTPGGIKLFPNIPNDPGTTHTAKDRFVASEADVNEIEGGFYLKSKDQQVRRKVRVETVAQTICAMVAFSTNRRHNGFQLSNSLLFLASGVTERVSSYLNYIGLCSSRKTAHLALNTLGKEAEGKLKSRFSVKNGALLAPNICYDNLDFQQKVHMQSVGHSSIMFHGTWGYIHSVPPSIITALDPAELTTKALNDALHAASKLTIRPMMFAPTLESSIHFEATLKSQIMDAVLTYVATPTDHLFPLRRTLPAVNPLEPELPNIAMLRLMLASDNSAAGVGEVFTGIIQQSGLTNEEFHSRLQIVKGDLGSCNLFESLRNQRTPARHAHTSMDNILPIPGAAHTLWNLAQAIYLAYWGDEKHSRDTGAWRSLHALGIAVNKPVTKKDFNLMLSHIERIHNATIIYCVLIVLDEGHEAIEPKLRQMTSQKICKLVDDTYTKFCSGAARRSKQGMP
ncbi:hypothetical protein PCANC_18803 [Puccinia coronata f. sp. avenae]|uniref:DUF6589 domain-containing protein n=1 Tax=Puccinia coronata f. sp. avenae TaxID=200324 RepID=A0A2N5SG55_9BASI|nr:hypothetical protein PCANC_18803 [Puccinia coronata f. sp. avenae]